MCYRQMQYLGEPWAGGWSSSKSSGGGLPLRADAEAEAAPGTASAVLLFSAGVVAVWVAGGAGANRTGCRFALYRDLLPGPPPLPEATC